MSSKYLLLLDDSFGGSPPPPIEHDLLSTKGGDYITTKSGVFLTARRVNSLNKDDEKK